MPILRQLEMIDERVERRDERAARIYKEINELSEQYAFLTAMH